MNGGSLWIYRLQELCRDEPNRKDLVFGQDTWSRGAIWAAAGRVAAHLVSQGFRRQQRVLIALPNGPEFVSAFLGVLRAGGVAIPLSPASGPARIVNVMASAEARFALVDEALRLAVTERAQ